MPPSSKELFSASWVGTPPPPPPRLPGLRPSYQCSALEQSAIHLKLQVVWVYDSPLLCICYEDASPLFVQAKSFVLNFNSVYNQIGKNVLDPVPPLWPEKPARAGYWIRGSGEHSKYGCGIVGHGNNKNDFERAVALAGAVSAIALFFPDGRQRCMESGYDALPEYVDRATTLMGLGAERV
jgi:hypothetical protein